MYGNYSCTPPEYAMGPLKSVLASPGILYFHILHCLKSSQPPESLSNVFLHELSKMNLYAKKRHDRIFIVFLTRVTLTTVNALHNVLFK